MLIQEKLLLLWGRSAVSHYTIFQINKTVIRYMKCEGQSDLRCLRVFRDLNIKKRVKSWRVNQIYRIKWLYKVGRTPVTNTRPDPMIK